MHLRALDLFLHESPAFALGPFPNVTMATLSEASQRLGLLLMGLD